MAITKNEKQHGVQWITIDEDTAGQRIDNFLFCYLKKVPKSHIYRILRKGEVRVNKKRIAANYRLHANDAIRLPPLKLDEQSKLAAPSEQTITKLTSKIIFENDDLLIINKPAGMSVHGGSTIRVGVIEALRYAYPKLKQLELAHRLDAQTSGILVMAKRKRILRELHELLRTGNVKKQYLALTKGRWQKNELHVDVPLHKNQITSGKHMVQVHHAGKASLTLFKVEQIYAKASLMRVFLQTGRTHQIRVHASYRQHPVAGDERYGDPEFNKYLRKLGLKRMFLHAESIEFMLPSSKELIHVKAPMDDELNHCLTQLAAHN